MWATRAGRRTARVIRGLVAALVLVPASVVPGVGAQGPAGDEVRLTIFHDSHIHGTLQAPDGTTFAHYAGLMRQLRDALPHPTNSLFLGNGDDLSGSPMTLFAGGGMHVIESLNAAGIDADTFGTDEFAVGVPRVRELVRESRFPWVSANVRDAATGEPFASEAGTRRWVIKDVGGVRVGITGATHTDAVLAARLGPGVRLVDPAEALREVVPEMRAAGAQVVVLLSHLLHDDTERVVAAVDGIDVSVGNHSGRVLSEPRIVNGTIVSERGADIELLGQLDLTVQGGRVVGHSYRAHRVTPAAPAEPAAAAVLERYRAPVEAAMGAEAGVTTVPLDLAAPLLRSGEAPAGNLIADALRARTGADVGLQQSMGVLPSPQPFPAGRLRQIDLLRMVPPNTAVIVLRVTGAQLLAALENSVSRVEQLDGRFAQVSGVRFAYDPEQPPGARLVSATVAGRPVVPSATYTVATPHATPYQPVGYDVLREAEVVVAASEGPLLRQVLLEHVTQQGTVTPIVEGRIQIARAGAAAAGGPPGQGALPRVLPRTGGAEE
jgi:2',3'-cyclic-nucleotide 2'-phosphodiesterase/3'-nucleotidase